MNEQMLEYLVKLAGNQVNVIDTNDFFKKYPYTPKIKRDLKILESLGYITLLWIEGNVEDIGVSKPAIDYFR